MVKFGIRFSYLLEDAGDPVGTETTAGSDRWVTLGRKGASSSDYRMGVGLPLNLASGWVEISNSEFRIPNFSVIARRWK